MAKGSSHPMARQGRHHEASKGTYPVLYVHLGKGESGLMEGAYRAIGVVGMSHRRTIVGHIS